MEYNKYKLYCSDKYKNGNIIQRVKYDYICPCNNRDDYMKIEQKFNKAYIDARNIHNKQMEEKKYLDRKLVCNKLIYYVNQSNANIHIKRTFKNIANKIKYINNTQNYFFNL